MAKLTYKRARLLVAEAIAENGGPDKARYVHDEEEDFCRYLRQGSPACIVGHVAVKVGTPLESIDQAEGESLGIDSEVVDLLFPDGLTHKAFEYLRAAQQAQDRNKTWAVADQAGRKAVTGL